MSKFLLIIFYCIIIFIIFFTSSTGIGFYFVLKNVDFLKKNYFLKIPFGDDQFTLKPVNREAVLKNPNIDYCFVSEMFSTR